MSPYNPTTSRYTLLGDNGHPDALSGALASGEVLTANQAAQELGIPISTLNYHMRQGHITTLTTPYGSTRLLTRHSAYIFARNLARYRSFDWFEDFDDPTIGPARRHTRASDALGATA